jgi:hypothetical protein
MSDNISNNFSFICDMAFFGEQNKLNIIGIFREINATIFPALHPQLYIVSSMIVEVAGEYEESIKIVRKEDKLDITGPVKFNFNIKSTHKEEFGAIARFTNVKFDKPGEYEVHILVNSNLVKILPLKVNKT